MSEEILSRILSRSFIDGENDAGNRFDFRPLLPLARLVRAIPAQTSLARRDELGMIQSWNSREWQEKNARPLGQNSACYFDSRHS